MTCSFAPSAEPADERTSIAHRARPSDKMDSRGKLCAEDRLVGGDPAPRSQQCSDTGSLKAMTARK